MAHRSSMGYSAVKYIFYTFNVLVLLFGCGILSLGIWLQATKGPYVSLSPSLTFLSGTVLCIVIGIIVVLVGMLGCCGSLMENPCMLAAFSTLVYWTVLCIVIGIIVVLVGMLGCCGSLMENLCMLAAYFVFVLLLFIGEVVIGALAFVYSTQIKDAVREEMIFSIRFQYEDRVSAEETVSLHDTWFSLQRNLKCCGVNNSTDWYIGFKWQKDAIVPDSCCVKKETGCGRKRETQLYLHGCLEELEYWMIRNLYILGVIAITVGVVQILAVAAGILLFCTVRREKFEI